MKLKIIATGKVAAGGMPIAVDDIPAEVVVTIDPLRKTAGVDGIPANGFVVSLPDEVAGKTAAGFDGIAAEVYDIPAEVVTAVDVETEVETPDAADVVAVLEVPSSMSACVANNIHAIQNFTS